MADHSGNSKPKMASPPVDCPYADHFGSASYVELAKKWVHEAILDARGFRRHSSVADKMDVVILLDSDDKKEEEAVLPTNEELEAFYLRRQVEKMPHLVERIKENIDIYKYDPWNHLNKMDVAKLHDSDDKKEEEAVLPGFKLHPTDEELVAFYLRRQVEKKPHLVERIKENIDIYKYDPWNHLNSAFQENSISLKSSDNVVLKMNKRAATSQSQVLRDVVDSTGGRDEIPVLGVTGLILSKITPFCKKIHKFNTQLNIIAELLKCTMDSYKAYVTSFVKDNQSIFSQLNAAADYLNIPNLMELMSRTMRDMEKGSTIDEISDRYSTLSIARILSPLGLSLRYSS